MAPLQINRPPRRIIVRIEAPQVCLDSVCCIYDTDELKDLLGADHDRLRLDHPKNLLATD